MANKRRGIERKRRLSEIYLRRQAAAGFETESNESLICPLCWEEKPIEAFTEDHVVPEKVGGRRTTLTCERCNNDHGSSIDSHLSAFQLKKDEFAGYGRTPATFHVKSHKVTANVEWEAGKNATHIHVVGPASNPRESEAIQELFRAGFDGEANINFSYGWSMRGYRTALLRTGYLALFRCFGYQWARQPGPQRFREHLMGDLLSDETLRSVTGEVREREFPLDKDYVITAGKICEISVFFIWIRLRKQTTSRHFAIMPQTSTSPDEFFPMLLDLSKRNESLKLANIPMRAFFK